MRVSFKSIIELSLQSPHPNFKQLSVQLARTGMHHAPTIEDARAAVDSGNPQVVEALLGASKLSQEDRKNLATSALQRWADNPLASRQAPSIVQALLKHGADPMQKDAQGYSALDKTMSMVSHLWAEEPKRTGQRKGTTLPPAASGTLLAQCVSSLRMAARLQGPVNLDRWPQNRSHQDSAGHGFSSQPMRGSVVR